MFRTELTIAPEAQQLSRTARVLTLGSCFADSIGSRLLANNVETLVNPFGTVFQPLMLGQLLRAAAGEEMDWQQHLTEARGRWQSYDLHGSVGAASPVDLLQHIQQLVQRTGDFVRQADVVLLTLGTAWAYRLRETGELVSNCHKQPADLFHKELLTPDEIINSLAETHAYLRRINPKLKFVLTVSPVRHLKDTLPLNAVSKSVLRVACHYLSDLLPDVAYFPAYELLTDDLRDYRFYAADMLHPSEVAEDYIWEKFARTYFDADFGRFRKEWSAVRQSLGHRPLHEGAPEHRQFLENTRERLQRLAGQQVEVDAELRDVEARIAALPVPPPVVEPEIEDDGEERIDIGEGAAVASSPRTAPEAIAETESAAVDAEESAASEPAARLSPEEFRSQRNRDRRGRNDRRNRNEQPAQATPQEADFIAPAALAMPTAEPELEEDADLAETDETADASDNASAFLVLGLGAPSAAQTSVEVSPALVEDGAKKKKRRSRGGAKRTARKHAARLAAEGVIEGDDANAEQLETAAIDASPTTEPQPAVELIEAANTTADPATAMPEIPAVETPDSEAAPKWNSRREGKKSTVIQKSTPVKRGNRRPLFNTPTEVAASIVEASPISVVEPAMPELPPVMEAAELPDIAPSTSAATTEATVPAVEAAPTKVKRNRGGKNRNKAAQNTSEATTPATVAKVAAEAVAIEQAAASVVEAAPATAPAKPAAAPRRKSAKPATPPAEPVADTPAATAPEPASAPVVVAETEETAAPAAPTKATKPAARPSRSKAKATAPPLPEAAAALPAPPPPAAVPASPARRSRASKPAEAVPEPAVVKKATAKPKAKATKPAAEPAAAKPKPAPKATKKA